MSCVISVENVSKAYRLGQIGGGTLRGDVARWTAKLRGKPDPLLKIGEEHHQRHEGEQFWALDDVSFEVKAGSVVGMIGRNGAGKSTLLKILSQVTTPTTGRVKIKGRIASLLEVGTGFHPELTGRENVFLNGAILGLTKAEIRRNFDQIVAFSEIEEFIDTPVKRYSSGMYVRLAFAVAAHLEPDILIVDEVLAVGDAQFQKKCMDKIKDAAAGGRTILFVSHNINAITTLCTEAIVLRQGKVAYAGNLTQALSHYGVSRTVAGTFALANPNNGSVLKSVQVLQNNQLTKGLLLPDGEVQLSFLLSSQHALSQPRISVGFTNTKGERIFAIGSNLGPTPLPSLQGQQKITLSFLMPNIVPGQYMLDIGFYDKDAAVFEEYLAGGTVEIMETNYLGMKDPHFPEMGQVFVRSSHTVSPVEQN